MRILRENEDDERMRDGETEWEGLKEQGPVR